ncbi:ester cyclase [Streptomyces sp. ME02-8801-2C]|uniref:ester cyclase n=1 Tax=Streptomyces sp. ME02-8801-2C TaxID=3028680 RepID=UPI0029ABEDCB|nr:ester cyclase [Streptomyces sp. ME02-8801-2C]MDX3452425.1 ester cyclase [Streptomyces sp. ME02-8801-2C]
MSSTAGTTDNAATLDRLHSAVNSGDLDIVSKAIDELVAPDVLFHAPVPMGATGAEAMKRVWEVLLRAFPDIRVTVEETIAEGDKVVSRNTVTGTHRGEYQGLAPTGRTVTYGEIFICRFAEGRITEIRGVVDVLTQLRQLGALPAPS